MWTHSYGAVNQTLKGHEGRPLAAELQNGLFRNEDRRYLTPMEG
jgi:hypothetical protein